MFGSRIPVREHREDRLTEDFSSVYEGKWVKTHDDDLMYQEELDYLLYIGIFNKNNKSY